MKICAAFYCELHRSLDRIIRVICFKHFWTKVRKLAGEAMIKNLSQLRPVKFLGLVSMMALMMTMFVVEIKLKTSKLSLSGIFNLEFVVLGASFIKCEQTSETLIYLFLMNVFFLEAPTEENISSECIRTVATMHGCKSLQLCKYYANVYGYNADCE